MIKILTAAQARELDRYTTDAEGIPPAELIRSAARAIAGWLKPHLNPQGTVYVFAGKGNNGADGLAVAGVLSGGGCKCAVCLACDPEEATAEWKTFYGELPESLPVMDARKGGIPETGPNDTIIDAIFGSGFRGAVREPARRVIEAINASPAQVIAVDIPSGMLCESNDPAAVMIKADHTLAIEFPKLACLLPEAGENAGEVSALAIGLSRDYIERAQSDLFFMTKSDVAAVIKTPKRFSHKGDNGRLLLVCGKRGMMGAALLAGYAAVKSGTGLTTLHIPSDERGAVHSYVPEIMVSEDPDNCFSHLPENVDAYDAIGIGCGLGTAPQTGKAIKALLARYRKPMVIDADALNIVAGNKPLMKMIPPGSILTPHEGEFRRLAGEWKNDGQKLSLLKKLSASTGCHIILKGACSITASPEGRLYFNSTGNPGMAKGGSGDVLTGMIASLLAQGYPPLHAAIAGNYLHGMAGDLAAARFGAISMSATDIVRCIAKAYKKVRQNGAAALGISKNSLNFVN